MQHQLRFLANIVRQLLLCIFHLYRQSPYFAHSLPTKKKQGKASKRFHLISVVSCSIGGKISNHRLNYRMKNVREFIEGRYIGLRADRVLFDSKFPHRDFNCYVLNVKRNH